LRGTKAIIVLASSLAKETGDLTVNADITCSNRESGENEYSYSIPTTTVGKVHLQT